MVRTAQISKGKQQSAITLRHEGQSIRNISRTLKVSSSAVAKTIKCYDETGSNEDLHRKGIPRVTYAAEDTFIRVNCTSDCSPNNVSQNSSNRHISTSTVQRRMCESGLHGRNAAKKPLLKDNNNKKRLAWTKKHEQWTLDWWKFVLWSDESKLEIFGSNHRVFMRCRVGEWMISACVVPPMKHGGGGVMVLCW
uniref:Transposase Tc1-like domain-containing protein n=1 Tax=Oncorhynchus tshawytscha TaxID=74940 RepID=A0AAZ3STE8_ONCTS